MALSTQGALVEDDLSVGSIIRRMRQKRGISARNLSLAAGLSESYVGKVEKGVIEPSLRAFGKIARHLALTPQEIALLVRREADRA